MVVFFPGSFDPFTIGHAEIVERVLRFADKVVIGIGRNDAKNALYPVERRLDAISKYYSTNSRVEVVAYNGLTADAVRSCGADVILRGVRKFSDYEYEQSLSDINRELEGVETILLSASPSKQYISSSLVREMKRFGKPIDGLVIETFK